MNARPAAILALLCACNSGGKGNERDLATNAVLKWAPSGIPGEVAFEKVECAPQSKAVYRCRGDAKGGGTVWLTVTRLPADFDVKIAEPIVIASLVEGLIDDDLKAKEIVALVKCGDRVRPATAGAKFQCSLEDAKGTVLNAAEVTIKDVKGNVDINYVTAPLSSDKIEKKIAEWLPTMDIVPREIDCGPRHRFAKPAEKFECSVGGITRKVVVTMSDFRGNVTLEIK